MVSTRIDLSSIDLADHILRESYGDASRFGFRGPLSEDTKLRIGKLLLGIVGADGQVSARERLMLVEMGKAFGVSEARVRELQTLDPRATPPESLVTPEIRGAVRAFLYDAIKISRVDGFAPAERAAVEQVARKVGIDPALIPAFEALLDVEASVARNRAELLELPSDLASYGAGPLLTEGVGGRMMEYGLAPGPAPRGLLVAWGKAVLAVAAADGELSEREARWFFGHLRSIGAPMDALEELAKFDPVGARPDTLFGPELVPFGRAVVFDAIRCARADALVNRERAVADRGVAAFGIERSFLAQVAHQLRTEDALRAARARLLAPP